MCRANSFIVIYIDRWGRRPTLLIGAALMLTWMFANAGLFATYGTPVEGGIQGVEAESMQVSGAPSKAIIACTYLFVASYAPTWGKSFIRRSKQPFMNPLGNILLTLNP